VAERILIEHLEKVYPGGNQALDDVTIDVEPGTFLVLLGPSGSGKTTLLRCLAGIERITTGRIDIGSVTVANGKLHLPPERRDLSMVFQDYALWPHLVARDNVAFAMRRRGVTKAEGRQAADAMLQRVGLGKLAERYPSELSGGEQQRVALARALVADTGLVLCDEPLSNLDADLRERMRIEISSLVRQVGATTIYITHDQAEAFALADRVGVLEKGRLVQLGAPEDVYARPQSPFVARFTGLAGELAVRVRPRATGTGEPVEVEVEVEPMTRSSVRLVHAHLGADLAHEHEAVLLIRPTAVRLCATDGEDHHLVGMVTDVAFRGRGYEHAVALDGGTQISGVYSEWRVGRGEPVGLRLEASGCHVFPRGVAANGEAGPHEELGTHPGGALHTAAGYPAGVAGPGGVIVTNDRRAEVTL